MKNSYTLLLVTCMIAFGRMSWANDEDKLTPLSTKLKEAKQKAAPEIYLLRYKFSKGEHLRWKVEHLVTVDTKIKGNNQTAKTRSVSTKVWQVTGLNEKGNATFEHSVDDIDMWQHVTGRPEVSYNSKTDKSPPPEYVTAAAMVKVPLSTITVKPNGQVIQRNDKRKQPGFGGGQVTIPMPDIPVKVGQTWRQPVNMTVKLKDGQSRKIKCQQVYVLERVRGDIATISLDTRVITPVEDPRVQVQLVQRLSDGTVKFDLKRGQVVEQQMDLDQTVLAFNGADSSMKYVARFSQQLLPDPAATAEVEQLEDLHIKPPVSQKPPLYQARGRDDKPALRR